jgi:flagellar hook-associated protein 3 FlgL
MRVTANTFPTSLVDQLNQLAVRQNRLQNQAATGQKLKLPEDDPVAMRRVLDMQGESTALNQYLRNVERHQELANASYDSIKSLKKILDRAGEIATLADGLKSPQELQTYATEVNELIRQGVQLANSQNRGDSLFAGTRTDQPPFVATTDANGLVTAVTYQGNTSLAQSEVADGVTLSAQSLGANTTASGPRGLITDSRVGADFFNHLIALRDNLVSGNTTAIASTNHTQLAADEDNVLFHIGTNGAVQSRLETTAAIAKTRLASLNTLVSRETDADLAQTLVQLNQTQTAYQAALQSGGTILNRSLLDYLK